jgi:hypothetical protein
MEIKMVDSPGYLIITVSIRIAGYEIKIEENICSKLCYLDVNRYDEIIFGVESNFFVPHLRGRSGKAFKILFPRLP